MRITRFVSNGWARQVAIVTMTVGLAATSASILAQSGPGGRGRMMGDSGHMQDMQWIHELLDNGAKIRRTVTRRADGVETLTESDDPGLTQTLQAHVASMAARIKESRPIHMRDPLFRAIFEHASKITLTHELTAHGIKVTETSTDPYVVILIQAHADVLNAFIKNGRAEAMTDHEVPKPRP